MSVKLSTMIVDGLSRLSRTSRARRTRGLSCGLVARRGWKSRRIQERVNMRNPLKQGGKLSEPRTRFGRGRGDAVGGGGQGKPGAVLCPTRPRSGWRCCCRSGDGAEAGVQQAVPLLRLDLDSVPWQAALAARGLLALKGDGVFEQRRTCSTGSMPRGQSPVEKVSRRRFSPGVAHQPESPRTAGHEPSQAGRR